jgi:hypothetical protein
MIEAQRTADKRGVKVANLSPHFRKMLVGAIRRGAKIKEKIIAADLTDDAAYALERHMIGTFHKNHPGQLWNTIDERFMSAEYLPDDWSNPVDPLYKVLRPLTPVDGLNGEDSPRFFGQVIPSASGPGRLAARKAGAPPATRDPKQKAGRASLTHSSTPKSSSQNRTMLEKVMRRSLTDPRFKLVKRSGKGFAIVWANHDAQR